MRLLILFILLLIGCRSVKKSSESIQIKEQKSRRDTTSSMINRSTQIDVNRKVDTAIERVQVGGVVIYPRGEFIVQADGTFRGSADSVLTSVKKSEKEIIQIQESIQENSDSTAHQSQSSRSESNTELNEDNKKVEKEVNFAHFLGYCIGALVLVFGMDYLLARLKIR